MGSCSGKSLVYCTRDDDCPGLEDDEDEDLPFSNGQSFLRWNMLLHLPPLPWHSMGLPVTLSFGFWRLPLPFPDDRCPLDAPLPFLPLVRNSPSYSSSPNCSTMSVMATPVNRLDLNLNFRFRLKGLRSRCPDLRDLLLLRFRKWPFLTFLRMNLRTFRVGFRVNFRHLPL